MKEKIYWSTFSTTEMDDASNRVGIGGNPDKDLEVRVVDKNGSEIKRWKDVLVNEHKILITLKFQWETSKYEDTDPKQIEYFIKKSDDCWEVKEDNIIIKPGKKVKFKKAKKEIHKNLLKEEFGDKYFEKSKQQVTGETDIEYIILPDGNGNYKVSISESGKSDNRQFLWERIKIKPQFWQNKKFGYDNMVTETFQEEENKFRWTKGWIALSIILLVIIVLGIIFRKKIWRWIKGEREQEKKVREQIDIF